MWNDSLGEAQGGEGIDNNEVSEGVRSGVGD